MSSHTVGDVARIAKVTVRTLHHYDEIGLLSPSARTSAGYRVYDEADLARLQRIRCYRELGYPLEEIAALLDDAAVDPLEHLRRQHALLVEKRDRLQAIVSAVEKAMEARTMGINLDPQEMFEVFGDDDPAQYADEVQQRWGDTDAYRESHRRTSSYTKDDWLAIKAEGEQIEQRYVDLFTAGTDPAGAEAKAAAEAHRQYMSRWFYECSPEMHRCLGEMYVADPRFTAHYDERAPGLAHWVRDAIVANADG